MEIELISADNFISTLLIVPLLVYHEIHEDALAYFYLQSAWLSEGQSMKQENISLCGRNPKTKSDFSSKTFRPAHYILKIQCDKRLCLTFI